MSTRSLIFGYLKGLLQRWYLVVLAIFDFIGLFVQPLLPYQFPVWGNLIIFGLVFILANYLLYREGQEEIFALKELYEGKLLELKEKIKELENRRPILDVFFQSNRGLSRLQVIELSSVPHQPNFDEMVHQEQETLKQIYAEEENSTSSDFADLQTIIAKSIHRQRKTAEEYKKECDFYLTRYREYLMTSYNYEIKVARFRSVSFAVKNTGTVPAEDVTLFIHFPDEFYFLPPDIDTDWLDYEDHAEPPKRPVPFESLFDIPGLADNSIFTSSLIPNWTPPTISGRSNTNGPFIKPKNSTEVSYEVTKLLHNMAETDLDPAEFFIREEAVGHSWELKYSLHAGNLPEPVTGSLLLEIKLAENEQTEITETSQED